MMRAHARVVEGTVKSDTIRRVTLTGRDAMHKINSKLC